MLAHMPYCCGVMFLESNSVKMSPVIMLVISAAKIMKPEYWILIVFFDNCWSRFDCRWLGCGFWRREWDSNPRGPEGPLALKASALIHSAIPAFLLGLMLFL